MALMGSSRPALPPDGSPTWDIFYQRYGYAGEADYLARTTARAVTPPDVKRHTVPTTPLPSQQGPPPTPRTPTAQELAWANGQPTTWEGQIYGRTGPGLGDAGPNLTQRYYGTLTGDQKNFYQSAEGMPYAWQNVVSHEANPDSYYSKWLGNQEGTVKQGFINASTADPNLQYTDYTAQQMPGLAHRYLSLPGWQKGTGQSVWYAGKQF